MYTETQETELQNSQIDALLTKHAMARINARRLSQGAIGAALSYGRTAYVRGAMVFAIGRREIRRLGEQGIDLSPYDGVQVVCARNGRVLTAYRNRDFRGLRPRC